MDNVTKKDTKLNKLCPHSSADQPPTSFYLVRLISKMPCMVLRLGFPIGTPAHTRNKVLRFSPKQFPGNILVYRFHCMISVISGFMLGCIILEADVINNNFFHQIVDELREQILKLRFPHRVQNKEVTPKTKRKAVGHSSPSKSPPIPAAKPALSDRPCVVVLNKPLEKLLIRSER